MRRAAISTGILNRLVLSQHIIGGELVQIPQDLQVEEILRGKQRIIHDGRRFEIVQGHAVYLRISLT